MSQPESIAKNLLLLAQKAGLPAAEVNVSVEKGFSVTARMGSLESVEHHQNHSASLTVYQDHRSASVSFSDFSENAIQKAIDKVAALVKFTEKDEFAGLADAADLAKQWEDYDLYHPSGWTTEQAIQQATSLEKIVKSVHPGIAGTESVSLNTYEVEACYANSLGFIGAEKGTSHSSTCEVLAKEKDQRQRDYDYTMSRVAQDLLPLATIAKRAAEKAASRLGSQRLSTRECSVLFVPELARGLWRALFSAISGGNLYQENTFLLNAMDQQIFPDFVHIYQNPHIKRGLRSTGYDGEGVKTRKIDYVENGVLKSYVLGSYSARKLKLKTTGNVGGIFNGFVDTTGEDFDALLKKMGSGLLVTELIGQGVNILTGNYSKGAAGFWVENGEIQYPVEEITVAGNLKDMFAHILAIGSDVDKSSSLQTGSVLIERMMVAD